MLGLILDDIEHFWLQNVRHKDGRFEGTIGNSPELVRNVKFGDTWRVAASEISDWSSFTTIAWSAAAAFA